MAILDMEKLRDTPFDSVIVDGVKITSRYQKIAEFERMATVVASLKPYLRRGFRGMDCNSKQTYCYSVDIDTDYPHVRDLADALDRLFVSVTPHGHNGITVGSVEKSPNWPLEDR